MLGYVIRRTLATIPLFLVVSFLAFLMTRLLPGDPARALAGPYADDALIERIRESLGLNDALLLQYANYLGGIFSGDLGQSIRTTAPVYQEILSRLPATIELAVAATLLSAVAGISLGTIAALKRGTMIDHVSMFASVAGMSIPHFWLGLMLLVYLAGGLGVFPTGGREGLLSLVLPAATLALRPAALITRLTRSVMINVLARQYIWTARSQGSPERRVVFRHAMRNALPPSVVVIGLEFGSLLGGVIIVETVFAWPGVGSLLINSINSRDFPVVQAIVLMLATIFIFVNLAVDLINAALDPRISTGHR